MDRARVVAWMIRLGLILTAMLWMTLVAASWMEGAEAAEPATPGAGSSVNSSANSSANADDEYSFRWLDPEKKIYVLQNRKYTKANRLLLSVLGGPGVSNPYRTTINVEPRLAYYLSEDLGLELVYGKSFNSRNNTFNALIATNAGTFPEVREIRSYLGGLVHWVPWYAKINVFNKILYFDWYFSGGAGTLQTARSGTPANEASFLSEDLFAIFVGTGHQYHLSRSLSVRLDVSGALYRATYQTNNPEKVWFSNYNFGLGLGFRI